MIARIWDVVLKSGHFVAMGLIAFMMVLVLLDVIMRKVGLAIPGGYNYSEGIMVPIAFLGLGYVFKQGAHINVDILTRRFSDTMRTVARIVTSLVALGCFGIALWANVVVAQETVYTGEVVAPLLPVFIPRYALVLGISLLCVQLLVTVVETARHVFKPGFPATSEPK